MGLTEILARANERARTGNLPYAGALSPREAWEVLDRAPGARLVDVRSRAEWELVGQVPGSVLVEWQLYPGWQLNPFFLDQLAAATDRESLLLFICRSGNRSHRAAEAATRAGFAACYNVLEGFEGDLDKTTRRRTVNGWKNAGLPWIQS